MPEGKKLFKFYLDQHENNHNTRSQFFYRVNRFKFFSSIRKPLTFFAPWYTTHGWLSKGVVAYLIYYYLIKKTPEVKHWNREGYNYEEEVKTPKLTY